MGTDATEDVRIRRIEFRDFKAFERFSVSLRGLNLLVGVNNSGKSTVIGAFRVLASALRTARSRRASRLSGPYAGRYGWHLSLEALPISTENAHRDFASKESLITFELTNGNRLDLIFPEDGGCILSGDAQGTPFYTAAAFKKCFPVTVNQVPILGPVEHEEKLVQLETVKRDLYTHRACRHFRSNWYYTMKSDPDRFAAFRDMVRRTWPGMDVEPPEWQFGAPHVAMFCKEERLTREIFWAGYGFQVWCQMLTHLSVPDVPTMLVLDEPETYLHPDLQRQLANLLRELPSDVVVASHSSEMMSECDPDEILVVDKRARSAKRLRDIDAVQDVLDDLGSVQNITLTKLARNRKALFVESEYDFSTILRFAKKIGVDTHALTPRLTPIPSSGFANWRRVEAGAWGVERTVGSELQIGSVFDRDYWPTEEIDAIEAKLASRLAFVHIWRRKEIENYLLVPGAIERVVKSSGAGSVDVEALLHAATEELRIKAQAQYTQKYVDWLRKDGKDPATLNEEALRWFEERWSNLATRLEIVPGKQVLKALRRRLKEEHNVSLSDSKILAAIHQDEVPQEIREVVAELQKFAG